MVEYGSVWWSMVEYGRVWWSMVDNDTVVVPMNSGVPTMAFTLGFTLRSCAVPKSMIFNCFPSFSFSTMFSGCMEGSDHVNGKCLLFIGGIPPSHRANVYRYHVAMETLYRRFIWYL